MATYRAIKVGAKRRLSEAIDAIYGSIVTDKGSGDEDLDLVEDMEKGEFESDQCDSDNDDIPLDKLRPPRPRPRPNVRPNTNLLHCQ